MYEMPVGAPVILLLRNNGPGYSATGRHRAASAAILASLAVSTPRSAGSYSAVARSTRASYSGEL